MRNSVKFSIFILWVLTVIFFWISPAAFAVFLLCAGIMTLAYGLEMEEVSNRKLKKIKFLVNNINRKNLTEWQELVAKNETHLGYFDWVLKNKGFK